MTMWDERTCPKVRRPAADRAARARFAVLGIAVLFFVAAPGCQAAAARPDITTTAAPDLGIGAEQFPDDDAVYLRREQHWLLEKNGTVHRRERRWLKLLNSRPVRRHADPRLDYCDGHDKLVIHTAQSILPDGTVMPVPDYSFNLAAPDDVGSWPQYAAWRQLVVSFSGIEPGVVLELDYEVVTRPGVLPWINADVRLDDDYPTVDRVVSVTVPEGTVVHHRVDGMPAGSGQPVRSPDGGMATFSWRFANLPGSPAEPNSLPWRQRCPRLRFTTCSGVEQWVSAFINRVDQAARTSETIEAFAEAVVGDEADPTEKIRKIAKSLHDSFNCLSSAKTFRSLECRPAADVLRANYGNPLESAALCAAALRALGFDVSFEVAVDATAWDAQVPTSSAFAGVVVAVDFPDAPVHVHAQHGVFRNPGSFGKHWLLDLAESGALRAVYVRARGEEKPSEFHVTGKVTIDAEGQADGELRIRLTGAFYDPQRLETADKQETLVKSMVGRVLSKFKVTDHSIATLSDEVFWATAKVTSDDALENYGSHHLLTFGTGPASLGTFPLPLGRSYRTTAVHLNGRVRENIDLAVELPEEWAAVIVPASLGPVQGAWGAVSQQTNVEGRTVRFRRTADITTDTIAPDDFSALREAINDLRAARSLHLVCGK